jgi:hypothetical protein
VALYRSKPRTIEARQFRGQPMSGVEAVIDAGSSVATGYVTTMQGQRVLIHVGEWVVTEADGVHHYPIADAEFQRNYEPGQ